MSERWVWIAQVKCPSNHCILAAADEYGAGIEEALPLVQKVQDGFDQLVRDGQANRKCGICGATKFYTDLSRTNFHSLEEAKPSLMEAQLRQALTAKFIRDSRN